MSDLKSFDEFIVKGNNPVTKAAPKAKKTSEANLFQRKQSGKQKYTDISGTKQVLKWRSQGQGRFVIIIKNQWDSILGTDHRISPGGETALINFLNSQPAFTKGIGRLDNTFFKLNVLVYTVKKDVDKTTLIGRKTKQKIQFSVQPRGGLAVQLKPSIKFISIEDLGKGGATISPIHQQLLDDDDKITQKELELKKKECATKGDGYHWDEEKQDCVQDEVAQGKCPGLEIGDIYFEYQSGADGEIYTVNEHEDGKAIGGFITSKDSSPSDTGVVIDNGGIYVYTDDATGTKKTVTNAKDKEFFANLFAPGDEYLCKLLLAFKKQHPKGKTSIGVKGNLFYSSTGKRIYSDSGEFSSGAGGSTGKYALGTL